MDQQTISWVFSGIGITVILSVFKFIFVPYPIISITLEEKAFLSGYHRFIRRLFIEFSAMIFLMYWSLLLPYPTQQSLPTWIILISGILLFILLSFFLVISWSEKILVTYLQKIKKSKLVLYLSSMPFILYIIILSSNFGFTLNWILNYFNKSLQLNQVKSVETPLVLPTFNLYAIFFAIAVLLYALFRLLIQPVLLIFNKISNTVIIATITLTNGTKLYNKYILRPSVDGNILIGDKPKITVDCEKIMLPKSSIFLIEFKRIYKSIEDKNSTTKRILLPPDYK